MDIAQTVSLASEMPPVLPKLCPELPASTTSATSQTETDTELSESQPLTDVPSQGTAKRPQWVLYSDPSLNTVAMPCMPTIHLHWYTVEPVLEDLAN